MCRRSASEPDSKRRLKRNNQTVRLAAIRQSLEQRTKAVHAAALSWLRRGEERLGRNQYGGFQTSRPEPEEAERPAGPGSNPRLGLLLRLGPQRRFAIKVSLPYFKQSHLLRTADALEPTGAGAGAELEGVQDEFLDEELLLRVRAEGTGAGSCEGHGKVRRGETGFQEVRSAVPNDFHWHAHLPGRRVFAAQRQEQVQLLAPREGLQVARQLAGLPLLPLRLEPTSHLGSPANLQLAPWRQPLGVQNLF